MDRRTLALLLVPLMLLTTFRSFPQGETTHPATARHALLGAGPDSDQDGLSDTLEQALLDRFSPGFLIAEHDCSTAPSEFRAGEIIPTISGENGTIYGQVFLARSSTAAQPAVEIHYYHLWRRDCGEHGHALDTEHVSTLARSSGKVDAATSWKATYWYAAAHENTVCDVSQITRAAALNAQDHGPSVWVSRGKHASYLDRSLCQPSTGCGADSCKAMTPLHTARIINLGERDHPMNGSIFINSTQWPLAGKMETTDFPANPVARLETLPAGDIAWVNPGRHPAQGVIAVSSTTAQSLDRSGADTTNAVGLAGKSTEGGVAVAGNSTGNAVEKTYSHTKHALGTSARHVGSALHLTHKPETSE
jgi:hypothetical protein